MLVSDFHFSLPNALIAQEPLPQRSASRLLVLDGNTGSMVHGKFSELSQWLTPKDLLVFNNTKVMKARLFGKKSSGGAVEILIEQVIDQNQALAQFKCSKALKIGTKIAFDEIYYATVLARDQGFVTVNFNASVLEVMQKIGHVPLPPYVKRGDNFQDVNRYQTVYAEHLGAVAAPTAGLHFDESLLKQLQDFGVTFGYLTLHVGAGTFQPMRVEHVEDHQVHTEWLQVLDALVDAIDTCKARGGRVIAVGTTAARALETAALSGKIKSFEGKTNLFLYPGKSFHVIDALITNFHLPESSLLMLVCGFAGFNTVMQAYHSAIKHQYRFFSYGDAMLITKNTHPNLPISNSVHQGSSHAV